MNDKRLDNLRAIRESKNLTRNELSEKSGVASVTIKALEMGTNNVDNVKLSTLIKLAQALHCKVIHLLPIDMRTIIK